MKRRSQLATLVAMLAMVVAGTALAPQAQSQQQTRVKIVSTLPMTGSSLGQTQTIVNAIRQALEDRNYTVCNGTVRVDYQIYDDATAAAGKWDPAQVASNANKIVADRDVVAVIGHFNSGATKISLPILNKANLAMVSPANTYAGLTKPGLGEQGEPEVYYP
ncbi:MAG: ABC transporter substrate-binding protein, partial [Thermostichales cyanobacterium DRC_bins_46]